MAVFCNTKQLITTKPCTKFQNPKSSSCREIFDRKRFTNRQTNKQTSIVTEKAKTIYPLYTRSIWKVLRMVFYLRNRFSNPIKFGIILKSYLSSILWHKFHEDIIMQTRKYYCECMHCLYTGKRKISVENVTFYLLKSVQSISNSLWN